MHSAPKDLRTLLDDPEVLALLEDRARNILGRRRRPDGPETLSLVNRTVMRLLDERRVRGSRSDPTFESRNQLLAYLVNALRWVMMDVARQRRAARRGGAAEVRELGDAESLMPASPEPDSGIQRFFERLDSLRARRAAAARVVELRYLFDFTWEEVAVEQSITVSQARSEWDFARAWLARELSDRDAPGAHGDNDVSPAGE